MRCLIRSAGIRLYRAYAEVCCISFRMAMVHQCVECSRMLSVSSVRLKRGTPIEYLNRCRLFLFRQIGSGLVPKGPYHDPRCSVIGSVFGPPVSSSPRCAPSRILRCHPYSAAAEHPQKVGNASEGTGAVQQAVRCRLCDPPCSRIIASCDVFYTPRWVGKPTNAGTKAGSP